MFKKPKYKYKCSEFLKDYKNEIDNEDESLFIQPILDKLYLQQNGLDEEMDGFDDAYNNGLNIIVKELLKWDGGISDNYISGIEDAIKIYRKAQN